MQLSGGQLLAAGWTAATPLFSSHREEENANESRHSDHLPMESWIHGSIGISLFFMIET